MGKGQSERIMKILFLNGVSAQHIIHRLKRHDILSMPFVSHEKCRPNGPVNARLVYDDLLSGDGCDMMNHRPVMGYTAREDDRVKQLPVHRECIHNVLCKPVAQPVTDLFQGIPFLLGVNQIGFCKNGTP